MTIKELAGLYKISGQTFWRYRKEWEKEIDAAARRYIIGGRVIKKKQLSKEQIKIIVAIMKDPPEGYKLVRGSLIKLKENE